MVHSEVQIHPVLERPSCSSRSIASASVSDMPSEWRFETIRCCSRVQQRAAHFVVKRNLTGLSESAISWLRHWLLKMWRAKGGGFYGLGFVIAFITLEIRMFAAEFIGSDSVAEVIIEEALESVLRIGILSFFNGFLALLWPVYLLERMELWGIAVLIGGYFGFERVLRPIVENWLPELKEHRTERENRKLEKKRGKRAGKA